VHSSTIRRIRTYGIDLSLSFVAGGVGVAPMKAFVEEREMLLARGAGNLGPMELYQANKNMDEYAYGPYFHEVS
jgi:hypothetical protein